MGIRYSPSYEQFSAAVAAGATLDELDRWFRGEYKPGFMAMVVAWYRDNQHIKNHTESAIAADIKKRSKKK